jgi:hypothetical protein
VNESHFAEAIHKETNARPGGAHHFRQHLLADFRDYGFRCAFFADLCKLQ